MPKCGDPHRHRHRVAEAVDEGVVAGDRQLGRLSLADAVDACQVPVVEVHISDTHPDAADRLIEDFERQIEFIRYLVGDLFSRLGKITLGRDTVTRLLNQRYLPTILGMEIGGQASKGHPFSVVLVRVDDLREILALDDNDGRDLLMQQISVAVVESVRTGDHAFRYGDLEFLIVCVETNRAQAEIIADDLRLRIRALVFHIHSRTINQLSVSVGVAVKSAGLQMSA